jgi:hypothetical protein
MAKLRKVVLTRREVLDCRKAFGAVERPRGSTSHRRFECLIHGQKRLVDIDESIDEFGPDSYSALWFIVLKQLQVTWEAFYAADRGVARRAGIPHRPPS